MGDQLAASGQIDLAIQAYSHALNAPAESATSEWTSGAYARTVCQLAKALIRRADDQARNVEEAIGVCTHALTWMAPDELADVLYSDGKRVAYSIGGRSDVAMLMDELGQAYWQRHEGDAGANIEIALRAFHQALAWTDRTRDPVNWAAQAGSLALAYSRRVEGEPERNIEHAIGLHEEAVSVFAAAGDQARWAAAATNLARTLLGVKGPDRLRHVRRSIDLFQEVLVTRTHNSDPIGWASTSLGLAHAYIELADVTESEDISRAAGICEAVLAEPATMAVPLLRAEAYQMLGLSSL